MTRLLLQKNQFKKYNLIFDPVCNALPTLTQPSGGIESRLQLGLSALLSIMVMVVLVTYSDISFSSQLYANETSPNNVEYNGNGLAKPAVAKDVIPGYPGIHSAEFVNDGNYGNNHSWISNSANSWIKIDLGQPILINKISFGRDRTGIYNDRLPAAYDIYVSLNDAIYSNGDDTNDHPAKTYGLTTFQPQSEYQHIVNQTRAGPASGTVIADFTPVMARFVKIRFYNAGIAIDEVEVFKALGVSTNASYSGNGIARPAVAKDVIPGYPNIHAAAFVNDGIYGNSRSWISNSANSWIKIDLGKLVWINQISFGRDRTGIYHDRLPAAYDIYVSQNDAIYQNGNDENDHVGLKEYFHIINRTNAGPTDSTITNSFEPMLARYVKIRFYNMGIAIDEVDVFQVTLKNPRQMDSGARHTCAVDDYGVQCWGYNGYGQLDVPATLNNPKAITAGHIHTCALDDDGVQCWGNNYYGQSSPPNLYQPREIAGDYFHTCALDNYGVQCWGANANGQSTPPYLSQPSQIGVGHLHTCALDDNGVECWGNNTYGQSTPPSLSQPSEIAVGQFHTCAIDDYGVKCWGKNVEGQIDVPSLSIPRVIAAGQSHTCALDDNGVKCWGNNGYGQIDVPTLSNPKEISAGKFHTCVLDDSGVQCWGLNDSGQTNVPLQIVESHFEQIGLQYSNVYLAEKNCAADTSELGTVYVCWDKNITLIDGSTFEVYHANNVADPLYDAVKCDPLPIAEGGFLCFERHVNINERGGRLLDSCGGEGQKICTQVAWSSGIHYAIYARLIYKPCNTGLSTSSKNTCIEVPTITVSKYSDAVFPTLKCSTEKLLRIETVLNDTIRDIFLNIHTEDIASTKAFKEAFQIEPLSPGQQNGTLNNVINVIDRIKVDVMSGPDIKISQCVPGASGASPIAKQYIQAGEALWKNNWEGGEKQPNLYAAFHSSRGTAIHELTHFFANTSDFIDGKKIYFSEVGRPAYIAGGAKLNNLADAYRIFYEILMNGGEVNYKGVIHEEL